MVAEIINPELPLDIFEIRPPNKTIVALLGPKNEMSLQTFGEGGERIPISTEQLTRRGGLGLDPPKTPWRWWRIAAACGALGILIFLTGYVWRKRTRTAVSEGPREG